MDPTEQGDINKVQKDKQASAGAKFRSANRSKVAR